MFLNPSPCTVRKPSPMRASSRSRISPSGSARWPLGQSRDQGNAGSPTSMSSQSSGEGRVTRSASPSDKQPLERSSRRTSAIIAADENLLTPSRALSRNDKANLGFLGSSSATSSPLKRSDGGMDVDRARSGSPVAKRRSLHGGTFGADFNIFEHGPSMADHQEPRIDSSRDFDFGTTTAAATSMKNQSVGGSSPFFGSMPKRSSSLRKSTLQQRHNEKPAFARQRPNPDLALDFAFASPGPAGAKGRGHRMSLENFLPPMQRDSPFSSHGALPNASVHVVPQHNSGPQAQHQPHPLSYTMTQSSSGSSLADGVVDDSPTHAPLHHHSDVPRSVLDLSRSLPMGATRPTARERSSQKTSSSEASYVTPHNYKLVKPLPAAFMSTGLISKRNRSTEEQQFGRTGSHAQMPDTPCKRPTAIFQASPAPSRRPTTIFQASPGPVHGGSAFGKVGEVRHEFGTPSTPFNPHSSRPVPGTGSFGEGLGVFGSGYGVGGLVRRDSFVSVEGDETNLSPSVKGDSQSSEYDLPPTPTKQIFSLGRPRARSASHDRLALESAKHNSMTEPRCVTALGIRSSQEEPKSSPSQKFDSLIDRGPHTPKDSILPPDPSGLSISAGQEAERPVYHRATGSSSSMLPPATPTAVRDSFQQHHRRSSITPINGFANTDVDPSLSSRFDKVELIGTGEFSLVYRVTEPVAPPAATSPYLYGVQSSSARSSLQTLTLDRVFAVKKSRHAYAGTRDRQRKSQEVRVLESLGQSDHVIHFIDSWEEKNHLYIQTEFCEEGSLEMFLAQVGRKARLDDFRIWKVMLELSLGVKHIHDAGFIHLDLKPANVLITFEGVLKIGDFGMANQWPAPPGIEGEGDREYIGPEILMGKFDKPADVFALGLIMLEIAGNVELPDNGPSWQKLRTGDMSDVPSLTSMSSSTVSRDSSGNPISRPDSAETFYTSGSGDENFGSIESTPQQHGRSGLQHGTRDDKDNTTPSSYSGVVSRRGELLDPPSFMTDPQNDQALDRVVRWMISPLPSDRPVVDQILSTVGVMWADERRRAGATIFEGNWGPADEILGSRDTDMVDV